ncbi:hypothetical protein D3Z09_03070 [Rahnella aquatilis]|nr:hypothetical protein D3Z09_03070 [Rahnella aquatilis]
MPDFSALIMSIWEKLESKRHALALILIPAYWVMLAYVFFVYKLDFLEAFPFLKYIVIVAAGVGLGALSTSFLFYISGMISHKRTENLLAKQKIIDAAREDTDRKARLKIFRQRFIDYYRHFSDSQKELIRELTIEESITLKINSDWVRNLSRGGWISAVADISSSARAYKLHWSIKELVISMWDQEIDENIEKMLSAHTSEIDKILNYFEKKGIPEDDEIIKTDFIGYPTRDYILLCFKKGYETSHELTLRIKDRYQNQLEKKLGKELIPSRTFTF